MGKRSGVEIRGKTAFYLFRAETQKFFDAHSTALEYPRGATLFREGEACGAVFALVSGKVKVSTASPAGRTIILRLAQPGDTLGMSAAMIGQRYKATADATEPSKVRILPVRFLNEMLERYPAAAVAIAREIAGNYRTVVEGTRIIALPPSPAGRLAQLLLNWAADGGRKANGAIVMPLTHQELAQMTATTRETITRTFGRLQKGRIIDRKGTAIHIVDEAALERLSSDPKQPRRQISPKTVRKTEA
ncbi:MAG TPA: Crp/Fnr family transcriptional regulator [Terriglobales bacterium]|nr:Crp/Fnr family transcriptional regulator [Terriglobales bacterium]